MWKFIPKTIQEAEETLDAMEGLLIAKEVSLPDADYILSSNSGGRDRISLYGSEKGLDGESFRTFYTTEEASCWALAFNFIDNLPTKKEVLKRNFNKELGYLIDLAKETNIEEEFIAPLRTTRKALTENLLTHNKGKMNA